MPGTGDNSSGLQRDLPEAVSLHSKERSFWMRPCFVCERMLEESFDFLARYQYELSQSERARNVYASSGGFCTMHTWQYERLASPQGISSAYPNLLLAFVESLRKLSGETVSSAECAKQLSRRLPDRRRCLACQVAARAQGVAIQQLLDLLAGSTAQQDSVPPIVCLPHLAMVLPQVSARTKSRIVEHMAQVFEQLAAGMSGFAAKFAGVRREPISEEEWFFPKQALVLLVGHFNLQPLGLGASEHSEELQDSLRVG
jgi:hypothetical protein